MTRNQIDYWRLQETKRANVAGETENNRHNVATEQETVRHNTQQEGIDLSKLEETKRSNIAKEQETNRANLANEALQGRRLDEDARHNQAQESYNIASLQESQRHNQAMEAKDLANLQEQQRHNTATEANQAREISIQAGQAAEQSRHNTATEELTQSRNQAQNLLDAARAELSEVERDWANIKNSAEIDLTNARKREIDAQISKLENDIKVQGVNATVGIANAISNAVSAAARLVDSIIPF